MFTLGNGHLTTSKQVAASGHNLFSDNLFRTGDKLLIVEIAARAVKRSGGLCARPKGQIPGFLRGGLRLARGTIRAIVSPGAAPAGRPDRQNRRLPVGAICRCW